MLLSYYVTRLLVLLDTLVALPFYLDLSITCLPVRCLYQYVISAAGVSSIFYLEEKDGASVRTLIYAKKRSLE